MKKRGNSSVFTHIVILFLLLTLFIYIVGLIIFIIFRQSMIDQYNSSLNKQISIYFNALEGEVDRIKKMHSRLLLDEDLNNLRFKEISELDYDMTKSINRVIRQLDNIKNISSNIDILSVTIPRLQRVYNSTGALPSYYENDFLINFSGQDVNSSGIRYVDGDIHIFLSGGSEKNSVIAPLFIDTKLSKQNIQNSIEKFNVTEQAKSFIVFNNMDSIISSGSKEDVEKIRALSIQPDTVSTINIFGKKHVIISYYSNYFDATYIQSIPEKFITSDVDKLKFWYYIFSLVVLITLGIYSVYTYNLIKKPIDILVKSFEEVRKENFHVNIKHKTKNEFSMVYHSFNLMVNRLDKLINEVYMQKILTQKSELRQLQAQINPHFLYNSFFILKRRISKRQYEDAEKFCEMLDKYFFYITKNYKDYSTLEDEVNNAKIYANIQGIRFSNRVEIEFQDLPEKYNKCVVPKLILQPILENAFKYGLEDREFDGRLRVSFRESDRYMFITVEDNGEMLLSDEDNLDKIRKLFDQPEGINEISGLLNIHKRLQLFTDNKESGLSFFKSDLGGLMVVMKIWLEKELNTDDKYIDC